MTTYEQIVTLTEQLPAAEKWRLVKHVLPLLEKEQAAKSDDTDWHKSLRESYGALRDDPLQRWPQGEYPERDPLD